MSDKLQPGISVLTSFSDGEQPTAAKLSSITAQLRYAAEQLEKAVGDIHGQSYPYSAASTTTLSQAYDRNRTTGLVLTTAAERQLDIANLGRLIGPASNMNPRMHESTSITEPIPTSGGAGAKVHEFSLKYVPEDPTAVGTVFTDTGVFATYVSVASNLANAGEYHVSTEGKVYCVTESAGGSVTYATDPQTYGGGLNPSGARHNVIPDLNQISAGGTGLSFSAPDGNGRRTATLPTATHAQSNFERTTIALGATDALQGEQLKLPRSLTDNFITGDAIPPGYLFLKNVSTGEVHEDAEYFYGSETTFLVGNISLTTAIGRGDKFVCITVGSDITTAIDDLRLKSFHDHSRDYGEPFIPLDSISGFITDAGASGSWVPSEMPGNFAPQYLHRDGYDSVTVRDNNWNDENCMRGNLLLGRSAGTPGTYVGAGESFKLQFSDADGGIYRSSGGNIVIENDIDVHIADVGGPNGGVLVTEKGIRGLHGNADNSVHMAAIEVTVPDVTANYIIDLSAEIPGWTDTEIIYASNGYLDTGGGDVQPNDTTTANRLYTLQKNGLADIQYTPDASMGLTGAKVLQLVVWYRP